MNVIIILGSPNDEKGNLSAISLERCEEGIRCFQEYPDSSILCTGGFGDHFNKTETAHGEYAKRYLLSRGIRENAILEIAESSFTIEDATKSKPIIENIGYEKIILVTSDYHMKRASLIFNLVFEDVRIVEFPSVTKLPEEELNRLYKHEEKAIKRDESNLKKIL
jgi:uncharacterized SAM-binding protein YcdF (DUF218 family)